MDTRKESNRYNLIIEHGYYSIVNICKYILYSDHMIYYENVMLN